jgi:glycolate oxidase FAD binding subunit
MIAPTSLAELSECVRNAEHLRICGSDSKRDCRLPGQAGEALTCTQLSGIIDFTPDDQVINVRAGTLIRDLQDELRTHGQCLPLIEGPLTGGTVAGSLSMNLPHELEGECGSWRDWVLGTTLVLADGRIAKSGSHAVKSVAGYDIHKLMIGARGTLAVVGEVILRTFPIKSLPSPNVRVHGGDRGPCTWIQRTKATDFARAVEGAQGRAGFDILTTSTLVRYLEPGETLPRMDGDWIVRSHCGHANVEIADAASLYYMNRAKALFDPSGKFNPGELPVEGVIQVR